jgi:hypothetical protein
LNVQSSPPSPSPEDFSAAAYTNHVDAATATEYATAMSADDHDREHAARKDEFAYLSKEIADLWRALAALRGQLARLRQSRINELRGSEPHPDAAKLN